MQEVTSASSIAVNSPQKEDIRDRLQKLIDDNDDDIVKKVLIKIRTQRRAETKCRSPSHTSVTSTTDSTKSDPTRATGTIFASKVPQFINKQNTTKRSSETSCSYMEQIVNNYLLGVCSSRVDEERINEPEKTLVKAFMIERIRRMEEKNLARHALVVKSDTGMVEAHRQGTPCQENHLPSKVPLGKSNCNDRATIEENTKTIKTATKPPMIVTTTATPAKMTLPVVIDVKIMNKGVHSPASPGATRSQVVAKPFRSPAFAARKSSPTPSVAQTSRVVTGEKVPTMVVASVPSAGVNVKKPSTFMSRFTLGRKVGKLHESSPKSVMKYVNEFELPPKIILTDEGENGVEVESKYKSKVDLPRQNCEKRTTRLETDIDLPAIFSRFARTGVHTEYKPNEQQDYTNATIGKSKRHVEDMDNISLFHHHDWDMNFCFDNLPGIGNEAAKSVKGAENPVLMPIGLNNGTSTRSVQYHEVDSACQNEEVIHSSAVSHCGCDLTRHSESIYTLPTDAISALGNAAVQSVVDFLLPLVNEELTASFLEDSDVPRPATRRVPTPTFSAIVDRSDAVIVLTKPAVIDWVDDNHDAGMNEVLPVCNGNPRWTWRDVVRPRGFPSCRRLFAMNTAGNSERHSFGSCSTSSFESYEESMVSSVWTGTTESGQTINDPYRKRGFTLQELEAMLVTETSIEDIWVARKVLNQLATASGKSIEEVVTDVCDRLDEIEMKLLGGM